MVNYGDITKIDGRAVPGYMLWENVPGALSSNKGEDFRIVLEETARVADENAAIPRPEKWSTSGCIMADGWSIAWRILDAQFWGVPQRRRRIALVADFGGQSAPEILFIRKGVSRDIESSGKEGEGTAETVERGIGKNVPYTLKIRGGCDGGGKGALIQTNKSATLGCNNDQTLFQPVDAVDVQCVVYPEVGNGVLGTLDAHYANMPGMRGGMERTMVAQLTKTYAMKSYTDKAEDDIGAGLRASGGSHGGGSENYVFENHSQDARYKGPVDVSPMLSAQMGTGGNNTPLNVTVGEKFTVRRLTPLECERLQGYPDGWTDIGEYTDSTGKKRKASDAARYKALGNSIALPPWKWVLKRISACYERDATMASLFDGIGGFPLLWEQINGKGSCLWTSEIEEFPMAVTRRRFGGEDSEEKMFEEQIADFLLFFAYEYRRYANLYPNVFDKGVADDMLNYLTKAKGLVENYDCKRIEYSDDDPMGTVYHCPKCGAELTNEVDNYCYNCGQSVYWTDVHFDSYDD